MNKVVRMSEMKTEAEAPPEIESPSAEPPESESVDIERLRMLEAILFAAATPLSETDLAASLPRGANLPTLLAELQQAYERRGINLVHVAEKWQFRTAPDLGFLLRREQTEQKRLSRAGMETLAIIAYHQPVTRAEIEDIRGVALSKGTIDTLMEVGWVRIRGRKRTPGRPVTYGTTDTFLVHFGLENVEHLPGVDELKAAGFLDAVPPGGLEVPIPTAELAADEDVYEGAELERISSDAG